MSRAYAAMLVLVCVIASSALAEPARIKQWSEKPEDLRLAVTPAGELVGAWTIASSSGLIVQAAVIEHPSSDDLFQSVFNRFAPDGGAQSLRLSVGPKHRWMLGWRQTENDQAVFVTEQFRPARSTRWTSEALSIQDATMGDATLAAVSGSHPLAVWSATTDDHCRLIARQIRRSSEMPFWDAPREPDAPCDLAPIITGDGDDGWFTLTPTYHAGKSRLHAFYNDDDGRLIWDQDLVTVHSGTTIEPKVLFWTPGHDLVLVWREFTEAGASWKSQVVDRSGQQQLSSGGVLLHEGSVEDDHALATVNSDGRLTIAWQDGRFEGNKIHLRHWMPQGLGGPSQEEDLKIPRGELAGYLDTPQTGRLVFWLAATDDGWELWEQRLP